MAEKDKSRESHFPAIEKKYGEKMSYWHKVMKEIKDEKYPAQMAHLMENYGFSRAHANALVMYSRGSVSSQKFTTMADYLKTVDPVQAKTIRAMYKAIQSKYPKLTLEIAWNKPMLKDGDKYVFAVSASKKSILIHPWSAKVLKEFAPEMEEFDVKLKTIGIPNDWKVNAKLLQDMVKMRMAEKK
jgi:uncharacterized protein YdhG (YjbR/CyaY superfamily)